MPRGEGCLSPRLPQLLACSTIMVLATVVPQLVVSVDPLNPVHLEVFHMNPFADVVKFGGVPINMDTANKAGDLYFDLIERFLFPLSCRKAAQSTGGKNSSAAREAGEDGEEEEEKVGLVPARRKRGGQPALYKSSCDNEEVG